MKTYNSFPLNFYNENLPTEKILHLFLKDEVNNGVILDTTIGIELNMINVKIKANKLGYQKIRGSVTYKYQEQGKDTIRELLFFNDFYVEAESN